MTPLEATDLLRRRMREDEDVKLMVSTAVSTCGCPDLYDWADRFPDLAVMLAESVVDLDDQTSEFERRLSTGDLS